MSPYSHLDLIRERYPQPGCLKVYQALRLAICGRSSEVDWAAFTAPDWQLLGEMAARDGVAGLLYLAWKQTTRPAGAPKMLIGQLGARFIHNRNQFEIFQTEMATRIGPALAAAGQKLIVLKGLALAGSLYAQPGQRPMVDMDCLTDSASLPSLLATLNNLGYAQERDGLLVPGVAYFEYHQVLLRPGPPALMLELHHNLLGARDEFFALDMPWFLAQTETLSGAPHPDSASLLTFTPAAHLLHLAIHLMMHHGEGESDLLHFYDLHLLLERWGGRIDWPALMAAARDMNLEYVLYAALQGCAARFETPLPSLLRQAPTGRRAQIIKDFIETRQRPIPPTHTERYLKKLANRPPGTQLALLLRFAFPLPEFMRRRYGLKPAWLWPLSYPLRWAIGLGHLLDMLLRQVKTRRGK